MKLFPDFDDNLRAAFQREVELFFASVVQEDRSVLDLLTANYTFVNERLAKHYGIPNIYGPQFRRVTLPAELDMRRGLLGKGALLTVTSNAARTSPVKRGKWFQATFLGVEPPQPPPGVEVNIMRATDTTGNAKQPTMRQQLEMHRRNPTCASCHRIFEPVGIALENFDAVGAWRTHEEGVPIDATGVLADGTQLDGVVSSLRNSLVRYSDQFVRVVAEKLLTYALGRGVEDHDMPLVRSIVRGAAANKYRFSSLVMGIVKSQPFQMNMKPAARAAEQRRGPVTERSGLIICLFRRSTSRGERSCEGPAPCWRCRSSRRWCRRGRRWRRRRRLRSRDSSACSCRTARRPATGCRRRSARCPTSCRSTGGRSSRSATRR